jgi:phosphoglycolate phosphatase-like HAD superfamily hydrolase
MRDSDHSANEDALAEQERLHDVSRDIVLVDMDGTLADVSHRLHHLKGPRKDWNQFFRLMHRDPPSEIVLKWVQNLAPEYRVFIVTGRPEKYLPQTIEWLARQHVNYEKILMRRNGDHRPDYVVKRDLLNSVEKDRVAFVIDDRPTVCDIWRRCGLRTIQVAIGEEY